VIFASAFAAAGAALGLGGTTDVTAAELGWSAADKAGLPPARAEAMEGAFWLAAAWMDPVASFAAANPLLARTVLVNLPFLVIGAWLAYCALRIGLVAYVAVLEREWRRKDS
jgi:hypothetical protein